MSFSAVFLSALYGFLSSSTAYPVPVQQDVAIEGGQTTQTSASDVDVVDVESDRRARLTVPVKIDGQGPYNFLIDTGSERTVVSTGVAGALNLERLEAATLISIAGSKRVETAYVPDLELGQQNYGGLIAPLLESADMGADGILGLDGLKDQRIVFDFTESKIEIEDVGGKGFARGYEIIVKGRSRSGQLILTDATIAGIDVTVVIDTGAEVSIGNRALQKRLNGRRAKGIDQEAGLISVTGQQIMADSGIVPDFRIGRAAFSFIGIAFADAPPFKTLNLENRPALFLGMSALRQFDRVAIDFDRKRVLFDIPRNQRVWR